MRTPVVTLTCAALFVAAVCWGQQTSAPHRATPAKTSSPSAVPASVPLAAWRPRPWDELLGINQSQFHDLGFDKMSADDGDRVAMFLLVNRPTFSCERWYNQAEKAELKSVYLFVESGSDNSAQFVGNLRSKLSAIQDVQLVYTDEDSDLILSVLGMTPHMNGRDLGFAVSTVLAVPCFYNAPSGYDKGSKTTRKYVDHYLNLGPSLDELAKTLADSLNASSLDTVRRSHANQLKRSDSSD